MNPVHAMTYLFEFTVFRLILITVFLAVFTLFEASLNQLVSTSSSNVHDINLVRNFTLRNTGLNHKGLEQNCSFSKCFSLRKCTSEYVTVFVPEPPHKDLNGQYFTGFVTNDYREVVRIIKSSRFYTHDSRQACLVLLPVDLLSQNSTDVNVKMIAGYKNSWKNDDNHLVLSMFLGTFQGIEGVNLHEVSYHKSIIAGGGFTLSSYRQQFDVSVPVFNTATRSLLNKRRREKRIQLLTTLLPSSEALSLLTSSHGVLENLLFDSLLLLPCMKRSSSTSRCAYDSHDYHNYPAVLLQSRYCLIFNHMWYGSPDLLDAMMMGCIPVFLENDYVKPFSEVLDWNRASITVHLADLNRIHDILGFISSSKEEEMRGQVSFLYSTYFQNLEDIVLTILNVLNERILPQYAKGYEFWNNPKFEPGKLNFFQYSNPHFQVNQPLLSDGFTAVILTYSRLESLFEVIQLLSKVHSLSKIIVVWNHMEVSPPPLEEFPRIRQPLIVIRSSVNKLTNRFLSYPEIKTDAILCIDDDITMVTSEEIQFGFEVWWLYPNHLVGFPPRIHVWNNDYLDWSYSSEWYSNFSMVLTGIAFYHKFYQYFFSKGVKKEIHNLINANMNCEDISMNFIISALSGKPPIKVTARQKFHCEKCQSSLWSKNSHFITRDICVSTLVHLFGWLPLHTVNFRADPL